MNLLTASLWRDEAFSALLIRHNPLELIQLVAKDSTPPLYYLLLAGWRYLFGESEVALRLLTFIFLILTAVMIWLIGRRVNIPNAWILPLLVLTNPLLVRYAFEVRAYALLYLLTAVAIYFFLRRQLIPLILTMAALLYTHIFGFWVVLILIGWAVVERMKWWWLLVPFVLFAPWVPTILGFAKAGGALPYTLDGEITKQVLLLLFTPVIVLILPYLKSLWRDRNFQLMALLWAVPIIGTWVYSYFKQFLFLDRYLIFTIIPLVVMVGMVLGKRFSYWLVGALLIIQAVITVPMFLQLDLSAYPQLGPVAKVSSLAKKQPFRDLAEFVKAHQQSGDAVINGTPLTYLEAAYYNLGPKIYDPNNTAVPTYLGKTLIPDSDVMTTLPPAKRYWVIESGEGGGSMTQPFPGTLTQTRQFDNLKLSLYASH